VCQDYFNPSLPHPLSFTVLISLEHHSSAVASTAAVAPVLTGPSTSAPCPLAGSSSSDLAAPLCSTAHAGGRADRSLRTRSRARLRRPWVANTGSRRLASPRSATSTPQTAAGLRCYGGGRAPAYPSDRRDGRPLARIGSGEAGSHPPSALAPRCTSASRRPRSALHSAASKRQAARFI